MEEKFNKQMQTLEEIANSKNISPEHREFLLYHKGTFEEILNHALTDPLTQLYNRRKFDLDMISSAERHTVFNFDKIADYYAHAKPEIQDLMEKSALVIIDFDKAIENGFVAVTKHLTDQYMIEHGGESEDD